MNFWSVILSVLSLSLNLNSVLSLHVEGLLANDCEFLAFDLCGKEHNKHTASDLLVTLQCMISNKPNSTSSTVDGAIDPTILKSLEKFSEHFCTHPEETCQAINRTLDWSTGCYGHTYVQLEASDSLSIMYAFAKSSCIKDHQNCPEKKKLNPPSDLQSFSKWYMKSDLAKFVQMIDQCDLFIDHDCLQDIILRLPCLISEKEGELIKHRFIASDGDPKRVLSSYCDEKNASFRQHFDGPGRNLVMEDLEFAVKEAAFTHDLCVIKEELATHFAYSKARCFVKHLDFDGENCFLDKTGGLPSSEWLSQNWLCSNEVENAFSSCQPNRKVNCEKLVLQRHIRCLPLFLLSKKISLHEIEEHGPMRTWEPPIKYLKCLTVWDENTVKKCYAQVVGLTGHVDISSSKKVKMAICNSNNYFYSFDVDFVKCLQSHDFPNEYIEGCNVGYEYSIASNYIEETNCTFATFGKPAEECFTKFTKEPIGSVSQLEDWTEKTPDSSDRLKLINACLEKLKKSDSQLEISNQKCINSVQQVLWFKDKQDQICSNRTSYLRTEFGFDFNFLDTGLYARYKCLIKQGDDEIRKNLPSSESINSYSKFVKWFCGWSLDEFLKLNSLKDTFEEETLNNNTWTTWNSCVSSHRVMEQNKMEICYEKYYPVFPFGNLFCKFKGSDIKSKSCPEAAKMQMMQMMESINSPEDYAEWFCGMVKAEDSKLDQCYVHLDAIEMQDRFENCTDDVYTFESQKKFLCNGTGREYERAMNHFCAKIYGANESDDKDCLQSNLGPGTENVSIFERWICQMQVSEFISVRGCKPTLNGNQIANSCLMDNKRNLLQSKSKVASVYHQNIRQI